MTPRERVIKVLLRILAHPYRFTRRELAQHFGVSMDAVKDDINAIRNTGLTILLPSNKAISRWAALAGKAAMAAKGKRNLGLAPANRIVIGVKKMYCWI